MIPRSVAIIGGGIAGAVAAVRLKQAGFAQVVMFERNDVLCAETSATVSEAHTGSEYPTDFRSGVDCLRGLVHLKRVFPSEVFLRDRTKVLISSGSSVDGEITPESFEFFIRRLQKEYEELVRINPLNEVLGSPNSFFRRLSKDELSVFPNAMAGFLTPQRGISSVLISALLQASCDELGIEIRFKTSVETLCRKDNKFKLNTISNQISRYEEFDYTVIAANYHGFKLARQLGGWGQSSPEVILGLRQIIVIDRSKVTGPFDATHLMLEGSYGAMESAVNSNYAFVYFPDVSQVANIKMSRDDLEVPSSWLQQLKTSDDAERMRSESILAGANRVAFPHLNSALVASSHMKIAVKGHWESRRRWNFGLDIPVHGCVNLSFITKATTAPLNAEMAMRQLVEWAAIDGAISRVSMKDQLNRMEFEPIDWIQSFDLPDHRHAILREMASKMGLPPEMGVLSLNRDRVAERQSLSL